MLFRNIVITLGILFSPLAMATDVETVAVLDTELVIDNKPTPHAPDRPGEIERGGYMTEHIRKALDASDVYELVSLDAAREIVEKQLGSVKYVHQCQACVRDIGQALEVDYVATVWVQVVSNLIINFNFVLRDGETGEVVKTTFIDIRGNNNSSWRTGTNYLLEKHFNEYFDEVPKQALEEAMTVWPGS